MHRRLGFRPRMATVLWGARAGDRVVGSRQDLELARRELELAELDRRLMAAAAKRLEAIAKAAMPAVEAIRRMGDAFERAGRQTVIDLEKMRRSLGR